jgi:acetyl esterase/lipase
MRVSCILLVLCCLATFRCSISSAAEPKVIELWPGRPPGETGDIGEEHDLTKPSDGLIAGKPLIRLGNVSKPTLTVYKPSAANDTGAAVLVCPGGGYQILAMDLEGTEVCDWLNSVGVTGVLLKYRVPKRAGLDKHVAALQDAQRAMGMLRARSQEMGISPERIGVLGFSAGGHLAAAVSNTALRSYPVVDDADAVSCRPDFTVLIYPAYLTVKEENDKLAPELKVSTNTPPTFIAMAEDDPIRVETALFYTLALKNAQVPVELHIYPSGAHGYGLRASTNLVTTWPKRAEDWLRSRSLLGRY